MDNAFSGIFLGLVPVVSGLVGGYFSSLVFLPPGERLVRLLIGALFSGVCCTVVFFLGLTYLLLTGTGPTKLPWGMILLGSPMSLYLSGAFAIFVGVIWVPVGIASSIFFYLIMTLPRSIQAK